MLRSMYASVSSMLTLQARQGVITNNLANINTTGYKGQTVVAKALMRCYYIIKIVMKMEFLM